MKKPVLIAALAAALFGSQTLLAQAPASTSTQAKLVEDVKAAPGELKISYKKFVLPNGLTIIVHEDHSDPIVHTEVTYHVGSARESMGKSGFAHFFEHMMFQGSVHVKKAGHFEIVEGAGGSMNGTTNRDRTNYFETMPSNYMETALWLEADRMGFLLDSVTQVKFENQRATVKNEKGQNYDNVPYGRRSELIDALLYPEGHPYSWQTIGYVEDLDRVNVDDLKNFFMRWYGPNNACLVVAGDVNTDDVVKLAEKYFGPIPTGPKVLPQRIDPVRLPDNRYVNYGDDVFAPLYEFTWPAVRQYHADEPALAVLGTILGTGNNSIIYKNFIKPEKAVQAVSFHNASELAGEFTIIVVAVPNFDGDNDVEKNLMATLDEFDKKGVTDDDMARAKGQIESQYVFTMQSVASRASVLSETWYLSHLNPRLASNFNLADDMARYQKVTKEDVMRVFRQYVKGKNFASVNIFPKKANAAAGTKEEPKVAPTNVAKGELEYKGLSYTMPVDNFDRSKRPDAGAVKPVEVPNFYTQNWDNGIKVIGTETKESPVVTIVLNMKGGNIAVGDPTKTGLASLTADMMGEATQNYTNEQFASELDKLGSSISFSAGTDNNAVQVVCLKKNLDATLKLFEEKLLRPKFNQDEYKLNQSLNYQNVSARKYNAAATADLAFAKIIYGKTMAAEPVSGTLKSIKAITMKDVENYYNRFYGPDYATLTIAGDVTEAEILPKLEFLKTWKKKNMSFPELPPPPATPASNNKQVLLVDKYKAAQSEIRIGYLGMKYDWNDKFFKTNAMNFTLGGNFNSRLNANLREDKGFTYGIRSYNSGYKERPGVYVISAGVRTSSTDSSLREIFYEVNNYRDNGITDKELTSMKNSITQNEALRYETVFGKASFLNRLVEYNLPKDYVKQQNTMIKAMTKEDINAIAKEMLQPEKMVILLVGDKNKIKAPIEKLGYKVVDYKEVEVATYEKN